MRTYTGRPFSLASFLARVDLPDFDEPTMSVLDIFDLTN
jgi:hypothetical protein